MRHEFQLLSALSASIQRAASEGVWDELTSLLAERQKCLDKVCILIPNDDEGRALRHSLETVNSALAEMNAERQVIHEALNRPKSVKRILTAYSNFSAGTTDQAA